MPTETPASEHVIVPRSACMEDTTTSKTFSKPVSAATVSNRGARMTSCGVPCATKFPLSRMNDPVSQCKDLVMTVGDVKDGDFMFAIPSPQVFNYRGLRRPIEG